MYELAKSSREKMKAKARRLASEKTEKVDSSTWSPAPLLRAEVKTGARPITKPSAKGIGESNAARDTKAAIGDPTRGAFKRGGAVKDAGVKNKAALGAIDPSPKRGPAGHYNKGGKVGRAMGGKDPSYVGAGSVTKDDKPVMRPKDIQDTRQREPEAKDLYTPEQLKRLEQGRKAGGKKWIQAAIQKPGSLRKSLGVKEGEKIPAKKLAKAAEAPGKMGKRARLAQTLGKLGKKKGGAVTGLTVVIADKRDKTPQAPMLPGGPAMRGVPMPPPAAMGAPPMPPAGGMPPAAPPPAQMPMGRKAGGRITKVASSYKDMEAGAATGEGRLQKTDIAKLHKGAPTRATGGKVSKVASSYKSMTAGSDSGFGRLQKTSIAKKKMGAPTK